MLAVEVEFNSILDSLVTLATRLVEHLEVCQQLFQAILIDCVSLADRNS